MSTQGCGAVLGPDGAGGEGQTVTVADVCPTACVAGADEPEAGANKTVTFGFADPSDWFFASTLKEGKRVVRKWLEEPQTGWLRPESMATPEDGDLAVLTTAAFATFDASFDFVVGQGPAAECWSTAAFVFGAKSAQDFWTAEFPYQGQQNRAEHFWVQITHVHDHGWRETVSMQGPVHGVTSGNSWPHHARAALTADGMLAVWVDGRPLTPVHVGAQAGYLGLATYNLLGNDVARVANVTVTGAVASASAFDRSVELGRSFTVVDAGPRVATTHVGRMVRAPNGDLIAPNGNSLLRSGDNGSTWKMDSYTGGVGHLLNIELDGKPALASFVLKAGGTPPCSDCALPPGVNSRLIRTISTTNGLSWSAGTTVAEVLPPPVECVPTAYGPKINCSGFGWRADGITSILPLKDGKTVLLFGVVHNGDLGMLTANDRSFMYTYAKDEHQKPVPTVDLGYAYALRSTDAGNTFSPMINLDGPWHGQTSMFPKGEPMQGLELSPFETAEGDIFVLDRPASSPWMWESWALPRSKGSAFGPATRGPFPLYACCECSGQTLSRPVLPLISARAADRRRHDHDGERRAAHLREVSAPLPGQALCQPQALL